MIRYFYFFNRLASLARCSWLSTRLRIRRDLGVISSSSSSSMNSRHSSSVRVRMEVSFIAVSAPAEGLTQADVALISDVVTSQTDYMLSQVRIIEVKP